MSSRATDYVFLVLGLVAAVGFYDSTDMPVWVRVVFIAAMLLGAASCASRLWSRP